MKYGGLPRRTGEVVVFSDATTIDETIEAFDAVVGTV